MVTKKIRRQEKILTTPGQVPTVPTVADHTVSGWLVTDIYIGEWCLNTADNVWYTRTPSGIIGPFSPIDVNAILNALDNKADLVSGKIPTEQLPAIAISEFLGEVADQTEMLQLDGQPGDWCIREDVEKVFIIIASPSSDPDNWRSVVYPSSPVTSVNGQTGAVVLTKASVGLNNVDNTADTDKPVSTAQSEALAGKSDIGHTHNISSLSGITNTILNSNFTTTSNSLQDVTGFSIALEADNTYYISVSMRVQCSTANGMRIAASFPSGASIALNGFVTNNATTVRTACLKDSAESATFCAVANTDGAVNLIGIIKTSSTPGNIQVRIRSATNGDTTTVFAYSSIRAIKM